MKEQIEERAGCTEEDVRRRFGGRALVGLTKRYFCFIWAVLTGIVIGQSDALATGGFGDLPNEHRTPFPRYFVAERVPENSRVQIDGVEQVVADGGHVRAAYPLDPETELVEGENVIEFTTIDAEGISSTVLNTIIYDPSMSTANVDLVYVAVVSDVLDGTIVVDATNSHILGIIEDKHVVVVSRSRREVYFHDGSILSTDTHRAPSPDRERLGFTGDVNPSATVLSPDEDVLFSGREVLDLDLNTVISTLPLDLETGFPYRSGGRTANNPATPAISDDGETIYCCARGTTVTRLTRDSTGLWDESSIEIGLARDWESDLVVCGSHLARVSYAGQSSFVIQLYDLETLAPQATLAPIGDFSGSARCGPSGDYLYVGSAGNPRFRNGHLHVVDMETHTVVGSMPTNLADNLAVSSDGAVFVSSGNEAGVVKVRLNDENEFEQEAVYYLGLNQSVSTTGFPSNDEIRQLFSIEASEPKGPAAIYRVFVNRGETFQDCWRFSNSGEFVADKALAPAGSYFTFGDDRSLIFARQSDIDRSISVLVALLGESNQWIYGFGQNSAGDQFPTIFGIEDLDCNISAEPEPPYWPLDVGMTLLFDGFDIDAPDVDRVVWTTPEGNAGFFGRTALRNPLSTPGDTDLLPIEDGSARLTLSTYNPTAVTPGDSFWGSQIATIEHFPVTDNGVSIKARIRVPEQLKPGMVSAIFAYGFTGTCPTCRDELDIEFLSNLYQPDVMPPQVLLNQYADEPDGIGLPGQPSLADLPGFNPGDWHVAETRWFPNRVEWYVDGRLLRIETNNVPNGPMSANVNIWAPSQGFELAYSDELQPVANPAENEDYHLYIDWIRVSEILTE